MVVKAYYSDKTSKTITDYTVSGYDSTKVGKQTVTVHYLDMTDTFDVTVAEGELSSIEIACKFTVYYCNGECCRFSSV